MTAYKHKKGGVHIRQLNLSHSEYCSKKRSATGEAIIQKSKAYVASFDVVKPKDIMNVLIHEYGVSSSYSTVWRALSSSKKTKMLEDDESFKFLRSYMERLELHNPGTFTSVDYEQDHKTFKRLFICPRATQLAFKTCRPMVIIDACHLRSKYGGIIMSACAQDGEGRIVPLAMGICSFSYENIFEIRGNFRIAPKTN
jgi:hypothetical protein